MQDVKDRKRSAVIMIAEEDSMVTDLIRMVIDDVLSALRYEIIVTKENEGATDHFNHGRKADILICYYDSLNASHMATVSAAKKRCPRCKTIVIMSHVPPDFKEKDPAAQADHYVDGREIPTSLKGIIKAMVVAKK